MKKFFRSGMTGIIILTISLMAFGIQIVVSADEFEGYEMIDTERYSEPDVFDDSAELMSADTVREYSKSTDGDTYLSTNFKVREFACKDGSDAILIDDELVIILQNIRDHFGKAVTITSAYRTVTHNANVGGTSTSYHLKGMAADIQVSGVTAAEVAKYAETIGVRGVGRYSNFVHVDTRPSKYYWVNNGESNISASTHGGNYNSQPYLSNDTTAPTISNAKIINISSQSFTINCDLSDNVGVKRVWLNVYGPDNSFKGYEVSAATVNFSHTINTAEYGGEGEYTVHIYAFDFAENSSGQTEIRDIYIMKPQEANLTLDKYAAKTNENVTFYYGAKYANKYWLQIYKDNTHVYSLDLGTSNQYAMAFDEAGIYSAYISCSNDVGYVDSHWVNFTIYKDEPPTNCTISVDKTNICIGDTVTFTYKIDGATTKGIGIDLLGKGRCESIEVDSDSGTVSYTFTEVGTYCCIVEGYNNAGFSCSDGVYIDVVEQIEFDYTIESLDGILVDGSFYAEAEIAKNTDRDAIDTIVIAVYKDGILIDRIYMRSKFAKGQSVVFGGYLEGADGATLKAFVWDSMTSMNTLSNVMEK